jgi:uncharacterized protein YjlB
MNVRSEVLTFQFKDAGEIPNNPHLPLLVYKQAVTLDDNTAAVAFERLFPKGGWYAAWRYGVYPFPHYHSTAHEVLGVYRGAAKIRLGHTTGLTLDGQEADLLRGQAGERSTADKNIVAVPPPKGDPIFGFDGPLLKHWRV